MTSLQVLHVEDQDDIRDIVTISLSVDPDIALSTAASGMEALNLLSEGYQPDVILLDVMMPEIDGIETLSRLRGLPGHAETPVIFMTARTWTTNDPSIWASALWGSLPSHSTR